MSFPVFAVSPTRLLDFDEELASIRLTIHRFEHSASYVCSRSSARRDGGASLNVRGLSVPASGFDDARQPALRVRHRHAQGQRWSKDRALLVVSPEPFFLTRLARLGMPQDVHFRWWTLSAADSDRQSGNSERVFSKILFVSSILPCQSAHSRNESLNGTPGYQDRKHQPEGLSTAE